MKPVNSSKVNIICNRVQWYVFLLSSFMTWLEPLSVGCWLGFGLSTVLLVAGHLVTAYQNRPREITSATENVVIGLRRSANSTDAL